MRVFVFRSVKNARVVGFAADENSGILPAEFAPWKLVSKGTMRTDASKAGAAVGADAVLAGIRRDGFYLAKGEVHMTRRSSPPKC